MQQKILPTPVQTIKAMLLGALVLGACAVASAYTDHTSLTPPTNGAPNSVIMFPLTESGTSETKIGKLTVAATTGSLAVGAVSIGSGGIVTPAITVASLKIPCPTSSCTKMVLTSDASGKGTWTNP